MNFGELLHKLLQVFHIIGSDDTGKNVTTFEPFNTTYTPVIYDPTILTRITGNDSSVSPIISSIFPSGYPTEEKDPKTTLVTGITAGPEVPSITTDNSTVTAKTTSENPEPSNETTVSHTTGGTTSSGHVTGGSTSSGHVTGGSTSSGHVTGETTSRSHTTGGTTSSGHVTGETTSSGHVTGGTTSSGHVTGGTSQTATGSAVPGGSTTPAPTAEPKKLTRGAVAGIVIGCLLLIAVVAAAVVFFVKNRNTGPEHQRLRV